jgi:transposase
MRFVAPKTAEAQAATTVFRTRDLLVRQRTQMINALRGHLAEYGLVVRKGAENAPTLAALAPAPETFRRGRDFAAWIGLTPLQKSSGGKERLGKVSKMGERTLRRLLIIGASSATKAAARKGATSETWLGRMLARKPRMLVAVALANKIARIAWALMARGGTYRASVAAA